MTASSDRITEISVASSPDYLPRLRKVIACIAASAGMDSQEIQDTKLALNEACANAIRHGSPEGENNIIQIRLRRIDRSVITEVTDEGSGFDPTQLPMRDPNRPGGLGIPLMRALSDSVEFSKNGHGMTVRMVKQARNGHKRRSSRV